MQSGRDGSIVVAKLDDGEPLFEALKTVAEANDFSSGMIVMGIGMLRDVEIGFWDGERYDVQTIEGPVELLSMLGSITPEAIHIHLIVGMPDHSARGGHLMKATVAVLNEITITAMEDLVLTREHNPASGLNELAVRH